jgi:hypothetical protein
MKDFSNLTEQQSKLLVSIVEFAKRLKDEPVFTWKEAFGGGNYISAKDKSIDVSWTTVRAALEYFDRVGFIQLNKFNKSFILCQKALDYSNWVHLPAWRKKLEGLKEYWSTEIRAGIIALIVGVLTSLLVNWLIAFTSKKP